MIVIPWIRIQIGPKSWIRIQNQYIWIHITANYRYSTKKEFTFISSYWMYCFLHSGVIWAPRCSANFMFYNDVWGGGQCSPINQQQPSLINQLPALIVFSPSHHKQSLALQHANFLITFFLSLLKITDNSNKNW